MSRIYEASVLPEGIECNIEENDNEMTVEICLDGLNDDEVDLSKPRLVGRCSLNERGWFSDYEFDVFLVAKGNQYLFLAMSSKLKASRFKSKDSLIHKLLREYNQFYKLIDGIDLQQSDNLINCV